MNFENLLNSFCDVVKEQELLSLEEFSEIIGSKRSSCMHFIYYFFFQYLKNQKTQQIEVSSQK